MGLGFALVGINRVANVDISCQALESDDGLVKPVANATPILSFSALLFFLLQVARDHFFYSFQTVDFFSNQSLFRSIVWPVLNLHLRILHIDNY